MLRLARILSLALITLWLSQPVSAQASATATVERLNSTLLAVMQEARSLGYQGRYEKLAPVLTESFDFQLMARVAVGKHWGSLDAEQQEQLIESFSRLSVATFAARFDGYSGESFRIDGEADQRRNTVLVSNQLVKANGEAIPINYLLRQIDGQWRIIDIFLDAKYSELALKRSEYTSVVSREGFDRLLGVMEQKIAEMASTGG
ncbi:MAG: ABC transporter substrate-binding protein [Kiloniellales bacterium]